MDADEARRRVEITARRQKVAELYLRGAYQTDIAADLGVDQATISRDLAELRKEWLDRSINHIQQKKAIELAKLDQLELTYWDAWQRSLLNAETVIERKTPKGTISETKSEGQSGNPAFLAGVLSCINKRCELLGLDAPKKIAPTSPDGQNHYMAASAEDLIALARRIADAGTATD